MSDRLRELYRLVLGTLVVVGIAVLVDVGWHLTGTRPIVVRVPLAAVALLVLLVRLLRRELKG